MPYTDTQPPLPWSGKTAISRHCSAEAAVSAAATRAYKTGLYLAWLRDVQQATDHGAQEHFGWPLSSVCSSIRNRGVDLGRVKAIGSCEGRYGKKVTIWGPA